MRRVFAALVGMLLVSPAFAQDADRPMVGPQDNWVYRHTLENKAGWHQTRTEMTVVRAGSSGILIASKDVGAPSAPTEMLVGTDWSRLRNVNGKEVVVARPFSFPLAMGKSWDVDYTELNPNRQHSSERFASKYLVVGFEDVTVPAGTFRAIKIEADGHWTAEIAPAASAVSATRLDQQGATAVVQTTKTSAQSATGRIYKAYWYVPEVKRYVKAVEEYFAANGVRNERYTDELEAYKVAN